jgi:GT2 family glycosyltransferase/spore maturation protein CgeB
MPHAGLQIEESSFVRGWIEDDSGGELASVSLLVDDVPHWTGLPRRLEHLRFDPNIPRTACGIWVALPPPKVSPQIVEVKLVMGDAVLAQANADLSKRYSGFVDKIGLGPNGLEVEGWVHDLGRPLHALELELRTGERTVASFVADQHRDDLAKSGVGLGNHAFSEFVRRSVVRDLEADAVRVVVAGTEIALPASDTLINSRKLHTASAHQLSVPAQPVDRIVLNAVTDEPPEDRIAGVCDKITEEEILGWALDLKDKDHPVVLDLLINNFVVATTETDRFRSDIAAKHECSGFAGFHFEIIPQMRLGKVLNIAVMARETGHILPHGTKTVVPSFSKSLPYARRPHQLPERWALPRVKKNRDVDACLALIVLNKNGAALLDRHFEGFADHNTYGNVEYVVVDHGSTDDSKAVVEKWRSRGIPIIFTERGENYSFSASNNYAVQLTRAESLLFCNNDIYFSKDALPAFMDVLGQENVGIAGLKLLDDSKTVEDNGPKLIQHLGVFYNTAKYDRVVHPVEARYLPILEQMLNDNFEAPAVTGAFLGIKREDFMKLGGFSEGYYYGYEDIDLCLRVKLVLHKSVIVVASTDAVHSRGYSRKKSGLWGGAPMQRNSALLSGRFGLALRKILRSNVLSDHQYWTATKPIIAFAVSEASPVATAGDFYTAYELARELANLVDATIVFLEEKRNWYDVRDIDVLVAMTHNYDLTCMRRPKQNLVTVGWARNWFSDWVKPRRHEFDFLLSSSAKGAEAMRKTLGHPAEVLRIATCPQRFYPDPAVEKTVDYVFTGSFWGHARDLMYFLEPAALPYSCEIYGAGWENVDSMASYAKGFVSYDQLAAIYRRTRVVIDDANLVTKGWGSVNSRVFDAISAGALPITNSRDASEDAFGGKLPWFENREELENLLHRFCGNEDARVSTLAVLQEIVQKQHTYSLRAQQFVSVLREGLSKMFRIAIKVPCPSASEAHLWGDYHFAQSLARELRALGHSVRVDFLREWNDLNRLRDDAVICLRGLSQYTPTPDQINLCWLISHPDTVSIGELQQYDRVYVASQKYCTSLQKSGLTNAEVLLQCVDTDMFHQNGVQQQKEFDVLFVGNSRNVMRPIIRDAISANAPLSVIGSGWDELLPKRLVLQPSVPHSELPETYAKARIVLNDHWENMAEHGFISNRLFDCVAAGAYVISDSVEAISDLFGPLVKQYKSVEELKALIDEGLHGSPEHNRERAASARAISDANSFKARAKTISDFITSSYDEICRQRLIRQPTRFEPNLVVTPTEQQGEQG